MKDLLEYIATFDPIVVAEYEEHKRQDPLFFSQINHEYGISNWISQFGKEKLGDYLRTSSRIRLEVRDFGSFDGTGVIVSIPSVSKEHFTEFVKKHGCSDIVDCEGTSIMDKNRKQISKMGPEFYLVSNKDFEETLPIKRDCAYHPKMLFIMKNYSSFFLGKMAQLLTQRICFVDSGPKAVQIGDNIEGFLKQLFSDSMKATKIQSKREGNKVYSSEDILKMFQSARKLISGNIDTFKKDMLENMKYNYGSVIIEWIGNLPDFWEKMYNTSTYQLQKADELRIIESSISNVLRSKFGDNFKTMIDVCDGVRKVSFEKKPNVVEKKVNIRSKLFSKLTVPCIFCFKKDCQSKKRGVQIGVLAEKQNHTCLCPEYVFNHKMSSDIGFAQKITQLSFKMGRSKNKKSTEIKAVMLVKLNEEYNPKMHTIPKSLISDKSKESGVIEMKSAGKIKYRLIGNQINYQETEESEVKNLSVIEYITKSLPNVLFLLEVDE